MWWTEPWHHPKAMFTGKSGTNSIIFPYVIFQMIIWIQQIWFDQIWPRPFSYVVLNQTLSDVFQSDLNGHVTFNPTLSQEGVHALIQILILCTSIPLLCSLKLEACMSLASNKVQLLSLLFLSMSCMTDNLHQHVILMLKFVSTFSTLLLFQK